MVNAMAHDLNNAGKRLHFKNPPIIEAVLAFSVAPLPDSALLRFQSCADEMRDLGYVSPSPVTQHQFQIRVESGVSSADHADSPVGVKFMSDNRLHAVQFNRTAFVFSRLGQYDRWEQFRDEGKRLWNVYTRISGGVRAILIGVRFINKLFIPMGASPEEYICALPHFPSHIAPTINEMFMRVVTPIADPPGRFIHNQALLPPEKPGYASVLFDNDFQFPVEGKTEAEIWELLESVREIKDRYFVDLTTEKMRETFDA
jgi:uncharacterized protein (TIGR04255 family)